MRRLRHLVLLLLALAACHVHSSDVIVPAPTPVFGETEPNDDAFDADWMGTLGPGDRLAILGSVRDDAFDPQDGFEFAAAGPVVVEFELASTCGCADLDVWLYDPVRDAFVAAFDSPYDPEKGAFTVWGSGTPFHLVVVSAAGDAGYRLDLSVFSAYGALAHDAGEGGFPDRAAIPARDAVLDGYRHGEAAGAGRALEALEVFEVDPATGATRRTLLVPTPSGLLRVPADAG